MRFLTRTGVFTLHLVVFLVLVTLISQLTTYFTAERYPAGATPSRLFPVVALPPVATPGAAPAYELLRWLQVTRKDPPPPQRQFRLPAAEGQFVEAVIGGFEPVVRFSTADVAGGRQRVELKVTDDDYVLYAAYVTDGTTITPEYLRVWGPTSALLAVFPAFVLTMVFSRLARRWQQRRGNTPPQPAS